MGFFTQSECNKAGHELVSAGKDPLYTCFACKGRDLEHHPIRLYCEICEVGYHYHCHELKPEVRHPFHLSHPLTLSINHHYSRVNDDVPKGSYRKCNCCRRPLNDSYYHCSICNYSINGYCLKELHLTIAHSKSHQHTLTLFPGRFTLPCNACGESLDDVYDFVYTCLPCSYMVHKTCIYLPRVIQITRHQHRLSHSSLLPHGEFSCGVCRQTVDINYGQYSCTNGCPYVVHSRCATRNDVWDGIDLEGRPEEPEEDIEPFERIDEETIKHFSHEHRLRLHRNYIPSGDRYMFCQVCTLPVITSASFYSCMQCDFVLDEACACLPRKTSHMLHKHPLILLPLYPPDGLLLEKFEDKGTFQCNVCYRHSCGFVYICGEKDCDFRLDTRCASLPDPLIHDCHLHDHPLFFNMNYGDCVVCKDAYKRDFLECMKCKFVLCIGCATLPRVAHYKHDRHPLTLCYGEEDATNLQYWCEICETRLDASKWFYTCDVCRVTLHLTCLLGEDPYMKPNHILLREDPYMTPNHYTRDRDEIEIALNGNRRPFCYYCALRCVEPLVFRSQDKSFCSFLCTKLQRVTIEEGRTLMDGRQKRCRWQISYL